MGCFNPDNKSFSDDANYEMYVDKTGLIEHLNKCLGTPNRCIAVSHARRFGKSQAARMIDAYYSKGSDSRELFSRFEIAKSSDFEKHLNKYNVIHLDIASCTDLLRDRNLIDRITESLYGEMKEKYPDIPDASLPIGKILLHIYQESGAPFVIIIDEWDCVVRNYPDRPDMVHEYLQFLHSLFKSEESRSFLALGYITGILPIKKIKNESALNNFMEYTMLDSSPITKYFGFTKEEVEALCEKYNMDFETIKAWYNGYLIDGRHMYNPNSVASAMFRKAIKSYWRNTSSFETINDLIMLN
ncbi:MAG: AAA family ATPase, partial [Synergistes sp.]|nr:AAA family ATPase [Synergistes sp.]